MSIWTSDYVLVLGAVFLLWVGVSAYVLITRALFDFRHLAFHGGRRIVDYWLARAHTAAEREQVLRRLPRRTLAGIASDAHVDPAIATTAAQALLERRWPRLLRRAEGHRTEADKWLRVATLRIFSVAGWHVALQLLDGALHDPDPDVVAAAVAILGDRDEPWSTRLLVEALVEDRFPRSRIAMHLDGREAVAELVPLLDHADERVRYWAVTLLAPKRDVQAVGLALESLVTDPSADVRAALAKALVGATHAGASLTTSWLLADPVWFVRAQAARALVPAGDAGYAEKLVPLLRDEQWWVRAAAKDALASSGPLAVDALLPLLHDDDLFARNGAAEILFSSGAVKRWSDEATEEAGDGPATRRLRDTLAAGGDRVQRAAVAAASGATRGKVESVIATIPSRSA